MSLPKSFFCTPRTLKTPVLFLIFNRPDVTQKVFSAIRVAQPSKLYIAADGPRQKIHEEKERCNKTRKIIEQVDWDCEVKTMFRENNLGCKKAVSEAINWFFEDEPEGIILEDDCLPSQSFFWFCQELLEHFRDDQNVGAICGFYSNELDYRADTSYFFSRYLRVWGWAGWRRTLNGYSSDFNNLIENKNNWKDKNFSRTNILLKQYWQQMFDEVNNGNIDTWDAQLQYLLWQKKQLSVVSSKNLIQNIGWLDGAHAHTKDHNHDLPAREINFPLVHLENVLRDARADKVIEQKSYRITTLAYLKKLFGNLIR